MFKPRDIRVKETGECVRWSLRCYKMLNSMEDSMREDYQKKLVAKSSGCYETEIWDKMYMQSVNLPEECIENEEFTLKHFKQLEKLNKIPIVVYNLEKRKGDKINIDCILAPSKQVLDKYVGVEICYLLMINKNHVCLIPDIQKYLHVVFKDVIYWKRCPLCFANFKGENELSFHLADGLCFNMTMQPSKLKLKQNAFIPHRKLIDEILPEITIVADCEAYMEDVITNKETQDNDEYVDMEETFYPRERPAGNISRHIPHSIGIMVLDHNLDKVEYEMIFGEDVAERFLDKVSEMIAKHKEKIKDKKYLLPTLTEDQYRDHQEENHCMFCNISFSDIAKNKKVKHHCHMTKPEFEDVVYIDRKKMCKRELYRC